MDGSEKPSVEIYSARIKPVNAILPSHFLSLTATRFVAAFMIVLYHFKDKMGFTLDTYTYLIKGSYVAVDFFFILSGFIMAHSYSAQVIEKRFNFMDFMKRRFARIYPVHFITLLLFVALGIFFQIVGIKPNIPEKYALEGIPVNILLLQAWGFMKEGTFNTPAWSISAEWLAYILFLPMIVILLKAKSRAAWLGSLLFLVAYYFAIQSIFGEPMTAFAHNYGVLRIIPEFFYGIATYLFLTQSIPSKKNAYRLWWFSIIALVSCLHFGVHDLIPIMLFGVIIYALGARACYGQNHILDKRPLVYFGEISYSMYMVHALVYTLVFNGADKFLPNASTALQIGIWLMAIVIVFVGSVISFHVIEEPGRKWINARFTRNNT